MNAERSVEVRAAQLMGDRGLPENPILKAETSGLAVNLRVIGLATRVYRHTVGTF